MNALSDSMRARLHTAHKMVRSNGANNIERDQDRQRARDDVQEIIAEALIELLTFQEASNV
jgi:hypothetical protein